MSVPRLLATGLVSALFTFALVSFTACGPDAVGVEDCRELEEARCEAGVACGIVEDVDACRRYYRDHCLHGLAVESAPGAPLRDACVQAIERAGECAADDPEAALDACPAGPPATVRDGAMLSSVCQVVLFPERTEQCAFLLPTSPTSSGGSGGTGAGGGAGAAN